jgi:hypothetical protein
MSIQPRTASFGFVSVVAALVVADSPDAQPSISGLPVQKSTKLE